VVCVEHRITKIADILAIGQPAEQSKVAAARPSAAGYGALISNRRSCGPSSSLIAMASPGRAARARGDLVRDLTAANLDSMAASTGRVRQY
jgi:hypothetical protein